jgi:hypothetical protein
MIKLRATSSSADAATRVSTRKDYQLHAAIIEFLAAAFLHVASRRQ